KLGWRVRGVVRAPHFGFPPETPDEIDPLPVDRPGRPELVARACCEEPGDAAGRLYRPDMPGPIHRLRVEGDAAPVRGPGRRTLPPPRTTREPLRRSSIGVRDPDLDRIARPRRTERDSLPIRRELRVRLLGRRARDRVTLASWRDEEQIFIVG